MRCLFSSAQSCDPFGYCHEVVYASRILSHRLLDMDLKSDFLGRTSPFLLTLSNHAADKQVFVSHEVIVQVVIPKQSSFITIGSAVAILNLRSQHEQPSHCISVFLFSFSFLFFPNIGSHKVCRNCQKFHILYQETFHGFYH